MDEETRKEDQEPKTEEQPKAVEKQKTAEESKAEETSTPKKSKKVWKIIIIVLSALLGSTIIAAVVCGLLFCRSYKDKWYIGTTINGVEVSGETPEESIDKVLKQYDGYSLNIKGRNGREHTIEAADIDYTISFGDAWDELFAKQHEGSFIPIEKTESYNLDIQISYDEKKLEKVLKNCALVKGDEDKPIAEPVSAKMVFDKDKQCYVCEGEIQGERIIYDILLIEVQDKLDEREESLDVSGDANIYEKPEITSEDKELNKEIYKRNKVILRFIEWKITDQVSEVITPKMINEFVSFKNGKAKFKKKAVEKWAKDFYEKYYTMDKTRTFKSHTGKKVEVKAGDYGWMMDYDTMLEKLRVALKQKISKKYIKQYMEDPSKDNKKAITITAKPDWKNVGFTWNKKNPSKDWDTKNFIEVSLAEQQVYVFRDGNVAFTCHCISGRPIPKKQTATGAFYLKEHQMNHVMVGEDYRIPTHYWVRITWSGIGFHPAPWQPWGRWSPTLYQSRGSHGCINLSPADATTIYNMTKTKEMVFIHW